MICFLLCDETTLICEFGSRIWWLMLAGECKPPVIPSVLVLLDKVTESCEGVWTISATQLGKKSEIFKRSGTICEAGNLDICSKTTQKYLTKIKLIYLSLLLRLRLLFILAASPSIPETREQLYQTPNHVFSKAWQKSSFWQNKVPDLQATAFLLSGLFYCVLECCLVWRDIIQCCCTPPYTAKHPPCLIMLFGFTMAQSCAVLPLILKRTSYESFLCGGTILFWRLRVIHILKIHFLESAGNATKLNRTLIHKTQKWLELKTW